MLALGIATPARADQTLQDYFASICQPQAASFHEGAKLTVLYLLPPPIPQEKLGKGSIVTLNDTTMVLHADIARGPSPGKFDMTLQEAGDGKFQIDLLMDHPKKLKYSGVYPLTSGKRGSLTLTGPDWAVTFKCYGDSAKKNAGLEANFHVDKALPPDYLLHFDF
ncbi:MAG TPA: hypothetical protein VF678_13060 [bacterium]